jgi:hypothetical protein
MSPTLIEIQRRRGDEWEVAVSSRQQRLICPTFQEAARRGYQLAADEADCEVVVHDAYHRVVRRERLRRPAASVRS